MAACLLMKREYNKAAQRREFFFGFFFLETEYIGGREMGETFLSVYVKYHLCMYISSKTPWQNLVM